MGQYHNPNGGIYLIEDEKDVEALVVKNPDNLAFITQTTLSVDDASKVIEALRKKFPAVNGPKKDDICYATQNRQDAVRELAKECDVLLVVGSITSSNSNRLRELGERMGCRAYLIDGAEDLYREWFHENDVIGLTAGASAPEILVQKVIQRLKEWGATSDQEMHGIEENMVFVVPKELRKGK
jgi:4-hydroxy-3-methylbut-2-enyl diphosphate reductase